MSFGGCVIKFQQAWGRQFAKSGRKCIIQLNIVAEQTVESGRNSVLMQNLRNMIKPGVWIITVAFISSIAFMYGRSAFQGGGEGSLAEVNGAVISYQNFIRAYQNTYETYQEQLQEDISPELERYLRSQVLLEMVRRELLWQESKKAKIKVSQKEIDETVLIIMEPFGSQENFMRYLEHQHILYSELEEDIEQQLAIAKLTQAIGDSTSVTEEELKEYWITENERISISYVIVKPEKYRDEIEVTEGELREYYEQNRESFRMPEKVKVDYILIKGEDLADKVSEASEEELENHYQEHLSFFTFPEERRVSHILIQVAEGADSEDDQEAKERIERIEEELKEGADFAALAREYSEDPGSAEEGGDLDFFTYYQMVPAFSEAVFSLEEVEDVSEIVETPFGYHLVKLTGIKPGYNLPFDEVEERVEEMWKDEEREALAQDEANNIRKEIEKRSSAFEEYLEEYPLRGRTTPFFAPEGKIEGLGYLREFSQLAFSLKAGEVSSVLEIPEGYCLLRLKEKESSFIPPLEDVAEKTEEGVTGRKLREIAEDIAAQVAVEANEEDLSILSTRLDLEHKNLESLQRADQIEAMSLEDQQQFMETAFSLPEGETSKPIDLFSGHYIIQLNTRDLLLDEFSERKEDFREDILSQRKEQTLDLWLEQIWDEAEIIDNSSLFFSP